jgi:hypothetical protein
VRRVNVNLANLSAGQLAGTTAVVHGPGCLTWHSTYETSGSASASYQLTDGPTTSGVSLMYVTLSSSQSTRDSLVLHSLPFVESLHLIVQSGAVGGNLVAWVDHVCEDVLDHQALVDELEYEAAWAVLGSR